MQAHFLSDVSLSTAASVQAMTARNLQFLQAIETTVNHLGSDSQLLSSIAHGFEEILGALKQRDNGQVIDSEGVICASLFNASEATSRIYARATAARQSACDDKQLRSDDGVVEAFDEYIEAVTSVHDLVEEIKDWIETHDAALEPSTGVVYSSVDDLMAALSKD